MNKVAPLLLFLLLVSPASAAGLININTASQAQLETLKGIGPTKAKAIIDYRTTHGPFSSIESLIDVQGIGPKTLEVVRANITVETLAPEPAPAPTSVQKISSPPVQKTSPAPVSELQKIAPVPAMQSASAEIPVLPEENSSSAALWLSLAALAALLGGGVTGLHYLRPVPVTETFPTADEFEIED